MRAAERAAAKAAGLRRYFTGVACPRGHLADRFVSNGSCVVCTLAARRAQSAEKVREQERARRAANSDARRENDRIYRERNPEKLRAKAARWRKANPDYEKKRQARNRQAFVSFQLRNRFRAAFHQRLKNGSAVRDLGCSIAELIVWLESQFLPGMNWDNYGDWHIDHRRPLASFDLTDIEQVRIACNWKNLQPLWAFDNLSKGAKFVDPLLQMEALQ